MRALAAAVAFVVVATAVAGCGNDVDDAGSSWPRRDVRLALVVPIVLSRRGNRPRGFAEED